MASTAAGLTMLLTTAGSAHLWSAGATQFRSGVNLVEVYATVTDQAGEPVHDLGRSEFQVFEGDGQQEITVFAAGEFPLSVAVGIDRSWSMAGDRLHLATAATREFLGELRPDDKAMVIAIGGQVEVIAPLSRDRHAQLDAVRSLDPWGTTPLHDAILASLDQIQQGEGRRALIVLSDGTDRYSQATAADVVDRARAADVLVYPIALGRSRPTLFAELAVLTGGRSYHVQKAASIGSTLVRIARELRSQYLLGYEPVRPIQAGETEWRSVRVNVNRPGLSVRARNGYLTK